MGVGGWSTPRSGRFTPRKRVINNDPKICRNLWNEGEWCAGLIFVAVLLSVSQILGCGPCEARSPAVHVYCCARSAARVEGNGDIPFRWNLMLSSRLYSFYTESPRTRRHVCYLTVIYPSPPHLRNNAPFFCPSPVRTSPVPPLWPVQLTGAWQTAISCFAVCWGWCTATLNVRQWYTKQLTDWLTDWMTGWLTDWLADWLINWLPDWLTGWLTD